jgi:hypothetical protein
VTRETDRIGRDPGEPPAGSEAIGNEPARLFGGGVLVGAVALGLIWVFVSLVGGGSNHDPADSAAHLGAPLGAAASAPAGPSALERCVDAAFELSAPIRAAAPAMDQWAIHIGAMNKLVVGAITLQQANAFWDQTRIGAEHRIAAFRDAMRTLRGRSLDCPAPSFLAADEQAMVRTCSRQVAAQVRVLDAARTAIATWSMHVQDMERLRAGKLSGAAASRMWLKMWQRGVRELTDYRRAARTSRDLGQCGAAPTRPRASATASPGMSGMTGDMSDMP